MGYEGDSFFNVKLIILLIVYSLESCAGFDGMWWEMFETVWSWEGGGMMNKD